MQCNLLFQCFLIAQHVSSDTPPIIRNSKTVIAAPGFTYVFGCRLPLRWLSHRSGRQPKTYVKPEAAITVFELLIMGGVSPETYWAIKKHWNNKFYTVASCWFFLWILNLIGTICFQLDFSSFLTISAKNAAGLAQVVRRTRWGNLPLHQNIQNRRGTHWTSYLVGTGVKRPVRETDHAM